MAVVSWVAVVSRVGAVVVRLEAAVVGLVREAVLVRVEVAAVQGGRYTFGSRPWTSTVI